MDDLDETVDTYERVADEYASRHGDRAFAEPLLDDFGSSLDGDRVLDVGCGPGWESETLARRGYDVVGVDLSGAFLDAASDGDGHAAFARMDMRRLGVRSASVDGVWACASFLHVPRSDADETLSEFARVLRPGGALFLGVKRGEGRSEGDAYDGDARRFTLYQPSELRTRVERAGFEVATVRTEDGGDAGDANWLLVFARRAP